VSAPPPRRSAVADDAPNQPPPLQPLATRGTLLSRGLSSSDRGPDEEGAASWTGPLLLMLLLLLMLPLPLLLLLLLLKLLLMALLLLLEEACTEANGKRLLA